MELQTYKQITMTVAAPPPAGLAMTPVQGPLAGGNSVTITGSNLGGATVLIGGKECHNVVVNEAGTSLTCTVPAGDAVGNVAVSVTAPGNSPVEIPGGYTYVAEPPATIKPPNKPRDLAVSGGPSAAKHKIKWAKPTNPAGNRPVAKYRLTINQRVFTTPILRKQLKASQRSYTVSRKWLVCHSVLARGDVRPALRYRVRVEALNAAGTGPIAVSHFTVRVSPRPVC